MVFFGYLSHFVDYASIRRFHREVFAQQARCGEGKRLPITLLVRYTYLDAIVGRTPLYGEGNTV